MSFKGKIVEVHLVRDARKQMCTLDSMLHNSVQRAFDMLSENPQSEIQIPKKIIPKYYIRKYEVQNLWKYNLPGGWRLIYWIDGSEKEKILVLVLEILSHKEYEQRFGY